MLCAMLALPIVCGVICMIVFRFAHLISHAGQYRKYVLLKNAGRAAALECPFSRDMANKFYVSGDQRAARVNDLFAAIAPRYDLVNDLQSFGLHRAWKRRVVEMANPKPGDRALDLCCGTGDLAFAFA